MGNNNSGSSSGVGIWGLLLVLFIGLKLTGHIDWSWWWVLSPLWISIILALIAVALYLSVESWIKRKTGK